MSTTSPLEVTTRAFDALDLGVLVVDEAFRILSINASARDILSPAPTSGPSSSERGPDSSGALELVEDEYLRVLLNDPGAHDPVQFSSATAWVNPEGHRVFVRCKRLEPHGLLVTLSRDRLRERDLVEMLRGAYGLTVRQQQIVLLLRNGLSNREIAERLGVSEATVKTYLTVVFQAFEVSNRTALLARIEQLRPER